MIKKILSNSILLLVGNIFGRLVIFLTNIIAARVLPQEVFGQYTMLRSTATMIENILTGSIGSIIVKKIAETTEDKSKLSNMLFSVFFINISIALIISIFILLNINFIIEKFFISTPYIEKGLYLSITLLIVSILSLTTQKIFIGLEIYKKFAFSSFLISIASIVFSWFIIKYYNFYGVFYTIILYFLLDFAIKFILIKNNFSLKDISKRNIFINIKRFFSFSYPLFLSVIISASSFWYSKIILINNTGGYKEIAIYDAAYQLLTIIMIITGATTSVALPMLSKILDKNNLKKILYINFFVNLVISLFISLIFILFSKEIMSIYGEDYIQGSKILIILSITSIFFTLSSLLNKYIISIEHKWVIFFNTIFSIVILFITLKYFIAYKIYALAYSILSFYVSNTIIYLIYILVTSKKVN